MVVVMKINFLCDFFDSFLIINEVGNNYIKLYDNYNNIICNLVEANFWKYNIINNISDKFNNRKFYFDPQNIIDNNIKQILNNMLLKKYTFNKSNNNDNGYHFTKNNKKYIDISINTHKFIFENLNSDFTYDDINKLFEQLDEQQQYLLFSYLLITPNYCHLVINNIYILKLLKKILELFAPLYRYLLSYTWITLYYKECNNKTNIKTTDDYIFDINTASELPFYDFYHENPKLNPYMPILVSDKILNSAENFNGIFPSLNSTINNNGICNLDEFKTNLNLFCTNDENFNIFDNINFNDLNIAITGSIIPACIQKNNPLLYIFDGSKIQNTIKLYDELYSTSDIDIIFKVKNNLEFINNVNIFYEQIVLNICNKIKNSNKNNIILELINNSKLFISTEFIKKNITNLIYDYDYIISNINNNNVKELFEKYFNNIKNDTYANFIKDLPIEFIEKFNKLDILNYNNIKLYAKDNLIEDIKFEISFKYNLSSEYIKHPLEMFSILFDDFFGIISTFHLPCVRGYYNGENVYLTPSCISAQLTFMNIDYKYIMGTKDIMYILNKYRSRGYGTWINDNEKKLMIEYISNIPFWNNLYMNNSIFGKKSIIHKLFYPRLYNLESFNDYSKINYNNRYKNNTSLPLFSYTTSVSKIIAKKYNSFYPTFINYDKLVAIDSNGDIVPVQSWIIDLTIKCYYEKSKNIIN